MKRKIYFIGIALMAMMAVACNSNDKMIDQYEEAINKGHYNEALTILNKLNSKKLTDEQSMRLLDISTGGAASTFSEKMLKASHQMGGTMNKMMKDERTDELIDASDEFVEDSYEELLDIILAD